MSPEKDGSSHALIFNIINVAGMFGPNFPATCCSPIYRFLCTVHVTHVKNESITYHSDDSRTLQLNIPVDQILGGTE